MSIQFNWNTPQQATAPPLMKDSEIAETERFADERTRTHVLPNPEGNEEIKQKAQGARVRFDPRLQLTLIGLLLAHASAYAEAKKDAEELTAQLESRGFAERLMNTFKGLFERALFGLQLREAYLTDKTVVIIERIRELKLAGDAAGAVPPAVAAIHAGIWPSYEKLNQRSQDGQTSAAALRAEGAQTLEEWRSYAVALEQRLSAAEARLKQELVERAPAPVKPELRPPADDRRSRR